MFTFGIFTSHIPYIAFVIFYAFLFISGINKITAGEIQNSGNELRIAQESGSRLTESPKTYYVVSADDNGLSCDYHFDGNLFKRKIPLPVFEYLNIKSGYSHPPCFSRPPPLA